MSPIVGVRSEFDSFGDIAPIPGQLPGMLPTAPFVPTPAAPLPTPVIPSLSVPTPMPAPPIPVPGPAIMQAPTLNQNFTNGKNYFDALCAKHTLFRSDLLAIDLSDVNSWYANNADSIQALEEIALPLKVEQIIGLRDWLHGIDANRRYSPAEMVSIIRKVILGENVSFPSLEVAPRILQFIKDCFPSMQDSEELFNWLMNQDLIIDLQNRYFQIKAAEKEAASLMAPLIDEMKAAVAARSPVVDRLNKARTNQTYWLRIVASNPSTQYDANGNPIDPSVALKNAQVEVMIAQNLLVTAQGAVDQVSTKMTALAASHPDLFPDSTNPSQGVKVSDLIDSFCEDYLTDKPDVMLKVTETVMTQKSQSADDQMNQLSVDKAAIVDSKKKAFNDYFQVRATAELQPYYDMINNAAYGYNTNMQQLNDKTDALNKLQAQIPANIQTLGGCIGWFCHNSQISEDVMTKPYFMRLALNAVANQSMAMSSHKGLVGALEFGEIEATASGITIDQEVSFWDGAAGGSKDLARDTLNLMDALDSAQYDMQYGEGKNLRDQIQKISDWLTQCQTAVKIVQARVNGEPFAKQVMSDFRLLPAQIELDKTLVDLSNQVRDISASVSYLQERMETLCDDIEKESLRKEGVVIPMVEVMDYDSKKKVYRGTKKYVDTYKDQANQILDYITTLGQTHNVTDEDKQMLPSAKHFLLVFTSSTHLMRAIEKDSNFILTVQKEIEDQARGKIQ